MCQSFFKLIEGSVSLKTLSNLGGAHLEMTSVLLRLEEYKEAKSFANKTLHIFRDQTFNQLLAYEYCFLSNFYTKKHGAATNIFKLAKKIPQLKSSKIREEKWNYLSAYNYCRLGDFDKSKDLLNNCKNLTINKSGWYLGAKLLLLIMSIKEKEANPTTIQLDNLLKLFRNLEEEYIMRFRSIYKIVQFLSNNQFDFKLTLEKQVEHIDLLKEGKEDYLWNPLGYEMIRFDEWFMEQIESRER
jgi:tetratricopeptide (TPR) repeat protein